MIAASADIKFACSQCGQRMVVEKSAAGLTANCPFCNTPVTVPPVSSVRENRESGGNFGNHDPRNGAHASTAHADFNEHDGMGLHEEPTSLLREELEATKRELVRQQGLFKKAVEECDRLTANATHAQAEVKSFQADRQQLKSELAQARQRAAAAENQFGEIAAHLAVASQENAALRDQIENDLAIGRERLDATATQLAVRERELAMLRDERTVLEQSIAALHSELAAQKQDAERLRNDLASAHDLLSTAAETEAHQTALEQELRARCENAAADNQRLSEERDELRGKIATLKNDLTGTDSGRELLALREQVKEFGTENTRISGELAERSTAARALLEIEKNLRKELQDTRLQLEEARRQAEANSEAELSKDNEILRGIIKRQNTMLEAHFVELRRLRRARFGLRLVYGLFSLALAGLIFFALMVFTSHGFDDLLKDLLR